jgi:c-di-GMP-binding flagellar brake protein YcgR
MGEPSQEFQFKRKFPRRKFPRAAGFLYNGEHYVGTAIEIGEGGLSLTLPQTFPLASEAVVTFQIPNGTFVCVRIEVRHTQKDAQTGQVQVGCLFKNLKFEQKREIRAYVSARVELN